MKWLAVATDVFSYYVQGSMFPYASSMQLLATVLSHAQHTEWASKCDACRKRVMALVTMTPPLHQSRVDSSGLQEIAGCRRELSTRRKIRAAEAPGSAVNIYAALVKT